MAWNACSGVMNLDTQLRALPSTADQHPSSAVTVFERIVHQVAQNALEHGRVAHDGSGRGRHMQVDPGARGRMCIVVTQALEQDLELDGSQADVWPAFLDTHGFDQSIDLVRQLADRLPAIV